MFDELATARNIKDRVNRHSVIDALKSLQMRLKMMKSLPSNGVCLLASGESVEVITPPAPIKRFWYRCDNKFHLDSVIDLYREYQTHAVVLANGTDAFFYRVSGTQAKQCYYKGVDLQKRQKKGGQSALRISRLAEEKRALYIREIVERINSTFNQETIIKLWVCGGVEVCRDICKHQDLDYRLRQKLAPFHVLASLDDTTITNLIQERIFISEELKEERDSLMQLMDQVKRFPDLYIYGSQEIKEAFDNYQIDQLWINPEHELKDKLGDRIIVVSPELSSILDEFGGCIGRLYQARE